MLYIFDDYEFDTQARELRRNGVPITLAPKVYHVLAHLIQHRDRLITKDELLEQVWPNAYVDDSSVKHCIMAARRALAERAGAPQYLKTMRGQGYRFVATVREHDPLAAQEAEPENPGLAGAPADRPAPEAALPVPATPERRCAVCQHVHRGTARFCSACGAPFDRTCSVCGEVVDHAVPFCPACGRRLAEGVPTPAGRHLPQLPSSSPPLSDGEHKLITMLCGVVPRPSTGAAMGLDDFHHLVQTVYDLAQLEVQRYGGTLQALTGEHFLALFGAPVALEDHARRAVLAALGLQQRVRQAAGRLASGEDLRVGLALHTGQVVVGPVGDDRHGTAGVVGDATTLVAALARWAQPGTILSSAATLRLVQADVRSVALPPLIIAGQAAPVPVHQVLEFAPPRGPRPATASQTHGLFLDREAELALLHTLWARVQRGQGQVVGVAGKPGLGKSRLLEEFQHAIGTPALTVLRGYCQSYGSTVPYLPLIDLLRSAWGITAADEAETIRTRGQAGLLAAGLAPPIWAPSLLSLLGLPAAADPLAGLSPDLRKTRLFEALHQVLLPHDLQPPRLLNIENLHWIDATSESYLATLVEHLAGTPTLLLVTYRPGYRPAWLEKSYATQMTLHTLGPEASRQVLRAVVGDTPLPAIVERQVLAKAEGNPFFLEELAHAVVEQGGAGPDVSVPDTIQAVLAARIDRLPLAEKQLLQTAAVIGRDVPGRLLQAITAVPPDEMQARLLPLRAAEFLYDTHHGPERLYTFRHALTHEVAYGSLLQEQRRTLHRQVFTALEEPADASSATPVERLAYHAVQGEVWDKALHYCRQAGAVALERSAHHEAALCYEQALTAARRLPQTRETDEQMIDLHLALRTAFVPLGEFARIFAHLRDAESLAEALHDNARLGRIAAHVARDLYLVGNHTHAITSGQRALTLIGEDLALQVTTHLYLSYAYRAMGDYRQAIAVLQPDVAWLSGARVEERFGLAGLPAVAIRVSLAQSLSELGEFAEGLAYGEEALHLAEAVAHPFSLTQAYRGLGMLYLRQGDLERATPLLERGLAVCREAHLPLAFPVVASFLGAAYAQAGRLDDALPLLEEAVAQGTSLQRVEQHAIRLVALSEGYVLAGRLQHAYPLALEALTLAQTRKEQGSQGHALRLLGALAAHGPAPEVAPVEAAYQQALAMAQMLGMRPLLASCHLELGIFYGRVGQRQQAQVALTAASQLFHTMEMPWWLDRAQTALAQLA